MYKVEVECRTLAEVDEAIGAGADIVMLDNMDLDTVREAVKKRTGVIQFEVSGNMTLEKVEEFGKTGIDFISVGELTHSVKAFDFSLEIVKGSA
jgi:nicotinate-nucleotide pyrophosphorylase (carboxylating)